MPDIEKMYEAFQVTEEMTNRFRSFAAIGEGKPDSQPNYKISTIVLSGEETEVGAEEEKNA